MNGPAEWAGDLAGLTASPGSHPGAADGPHVEREVLRRRLDSGDQR